MMKWFCLLFLRHFWPQSNLVCVSVLDALSGFVHTLHIALQHNYEDILYSFIVGHNLSDVRQVQSYLRQNTRHISRWISPHSSSYFGSACQSWFRSPRGNNSLLSSFFWKLKISLYNIYNINKIKRFCGLFLFIWNR